MPGLWKIDGYDVATATPREKLDLTGSIWTWLMESLSLTRTPPASADTLPALERPLRHPLRTRHDSSV
ncbi:hypothetical protein ACFQWF_24885 [Methylorubrum suomiense]